MEDRRVIIPPQPYPLARAELVLALLATFLLSFTTTVQILY